MALDDNLREEYKKAAKVSDKQVEQAVGQPEVPEAVARRLRRPAVALAQDGVRQLMADALIISARYNEVNRANKGKDAREIVPGDALNRDRELLGAMIADEYRLTNPFGKSEGKAETINKILSGTIRPEMLGAGGFESPDHELQVHADGDQPHTAVSHGRLVMKGRGLAEFKKTGSKRWRKLDGEYRTTHTFVFRDARWQLTASAMTQIPPDLDFVFVGERD
jgi:hypothetical protein